MDLSSDEAVIYRDGRRLIIEPTWPFDSYSTPVCSHSRSAIHADPPRCALRPPARRRFPVAGELRFDARKKGSRVLYG
jgi:hypothetical protein